jgi:6-phosphogluconate dehydrogenase
MKIAIHGLGRMGMQIAQKVAESEHTLIAHNRSKDKIDQAVSFGAVSAYEKQDVLNAFGDEQIIIWVMLPAANSAVEIAEWLKIVPKGSIFIDGGNSDYRLTRELNKVVTAAGSMLVDIGTSGGVWGYQNGFCMMAGSDDEAAFRAVEPAVKILAQPEGGYHYFGASGSGHFVKMTHNAIEYGMMQALAEGYRILKEGPYADLDLAAAGDVWQHHSVITSWLNELSRDALQENPTLEGIDGYVSENGEGRWTLETAQSLNIPMPVLQASLDVRAASREGDISFTTQMLAAMRNKFGGHAINGDK